MTSPYQPQPVDPGDPYAAEPESVVPPQPAPHPHYGDPRAYGAHPQQYMAQPPYGAQLPAYQPYPPQMPMGMMQYGQPMPAGRSAVTTSAVLSIFLGWIGALIGLQSSQRDPLTKENLRAVMNLQLSALIVVGGGFFLSLFLTPVLMIWMLVAMLYGISTIVTACNIGAAYSRGEVYRPFLAFKML